MIILLIISFLFGSFIMTRYGIKQKWQPSDIVFFSLVTAYSFTVMVYVISVFVFYQ